MKNLLAVILITICVGSTDVRSQAKVDRITGHLYVVFGLGGNVAFLTTDEGVLVVDSGNRESDGEQVIAKIREVSDKPIRYPVLTHYHGDHVSGAIAFPARVTVISHDNTRQNIPFNRESALKSISQEIEKIEKNMRGLTVQGGVELEKAQKELERRKKQLDEYRGRRYRLPEVTFSDSMTIHIGGESVQLFYPGPGHTNGDIIIRFVNEKVIHVGDLLFNNKWVPRLDGDAGCSVQNWLRIYDKVGMMDFEKLVPGHGEVTDKEGFRYASKRRREFLKDLRSEVQELLKEEVSLEEIKARVKLSKYQDMELHEVLLPYNIEGVFREIMDEKRNK